jgi:hypothetical protein
MSHTTMMTAVVVFAALTLSAAPAHAERHGFRGHGGAGFSRGPSRAMAMPRAFAAPRGFGVRRIAAVGPFRSPAFALRPAVRLGYGLSAGYPVAIPAYSYRYPAYSYPYPAPYAPYPVVAGPVYRAPVALGVPVPLSLAIAGRIVRGAGRLALRLLIP